MTTGAAADHAGRTWTDTESDAAFEALGDKVIDATRRFIRSNRRLRIQPNLYTVHGHELSRTQIEVLDRHADRQPPGETRSGRSFQRPREPQVSGRHMHHRRCGLHRDGSRGAPRGHARTLSSMEPSRRLLLAELLDEYTTLMEGIRTDDDNDSAAD